MDSLLVFIVFAIMHYRMLNILPDGFVYLCFVAMKTIQQPQVFKIIRG